MELATGSGSGSAGGKTSEMREGSIVSLKLKNFLVYRDVKVHLGPRLNMVVGPNGSGKSTLVCAIALGLGGSPKVRKVLLAYFAHRGSLPRSVSEVDYSCIVWGLSRPL